MGQVHEFAGEVCSSPSGILLTVEDVVVCSKCGAIVAGWPYVDPAYADTGEPHSCAQVSLEGPLGAEEFLESMGVERNERTD